MIVYGIKRVFFYKEKHDFLWEKHYCLWIFFSIMVKPVFLSSKTGLSMG